MKSSEEPRNDYEQLQADLNDELSAAQDYYERTGNVMQNLDPVAQRKVLENWKEGHQ